MPSPNRDYSRSGFYNVFHILPQGHDKPLKQAFYNTAATLFITLACGIAIAVYYILQPFLKPLLWALLCGSILFPFKNTLTVVSREWLTELHSSKMPLIIGITLLPITFVYNYADKLIDHLWNNVLFFMVSCFSVPLLTLVFSLWPLATLVDAITTISTFIYDLLINFSSLWIWTILISFLLGVYFFWDEKSSIYFKFLSIPVWTSIVFHIASLTNTSFLRIPLTILFIVLLIAGITAELISFVKKMSNKLIMEEHNFNKSNMEKIFENHDISIKLADTYIISEASQPNVTNNILNQESNNPSCHPDISSDASLHKELKISSSTPKNLNISDALSSIVSNNTLNLELKNYYNSPNNLNNSDASMSKISNDILNNESKISISSQNITQLDASLPSNTLKKESKTFISPPNNLNITGASMSNSIFNKILKSPSSACIWVVFWAFFVMQLWMYKIIIIVLPLLIAILCFKKLVNYLDINSSVSNWIINCYYKVKQILVVDPRLDLFCPKPFRILCSWLVKGDRKIVLTLINIIDKLISALIIMILLLSIAGVIIFSAMEVHRESMHLINIGTNILNKSQNPELAKWLPDNEVMTNAMDSMINNAYIYGREWITSRLNGLFDGNEENKERVARQVLKLWDDVYSKWRKDNYSDNTVYGNMRLRTGTQDMMDFISMYGSYKKLRMNNLNLFTIAKDNVDVFISVVQTIWTVAMSNLAMIVKIVTSMTSVIFGGGTAILNLIISVVVFLTTLFYLLSLSNMQYRPIEFFSSISIYFDAGNTIQDAIKSVFLASGKMGLFYGLYTYVTHSLFGVQIVFIPSALAAIFAVIPILGTYMASVPAVIELWLVYGMKLEAILFFIAHYIPTLFVDALFYSEIKQGHQYINGLAIAGGVFWLGLEGAIIGPVMLCCFIVAINMYKNIMKLDISPDLHELDCKKPKPQMSL